MFKYAFILVVLILVAPVAWSTSFLRTHNDFLMLSDTEKDAVIIKTMELVAELESKYNYETQKYGFSKDRYESYSKYLKQITSLLLINSAYAQDKNSKLSWEQLGSSFHQFMTKKDANKCLFAGWVSQTKKVNDKTICSHPYNVKSKDGKVINIGYPRPGVGSGCLLPNGSADPKKIQCSPLIFGYKEISKESLFCVDSANGAHNSSYSCMKLALAETNKAGFDSREVRLEFLREKLIANPKVFEEVQKFVYRTCVCPDLPVGSLFDQDYHKYMRPHRTCYGMMEMMSETIQTCEQTRLPIDASIFDNLKKFTEKQIIYNSKSDSKEDIADTFYQRYVDEEVKKKAPQEYSRLCEDNKALVPLLNDPVKKVEILESNKTTESPNSNMNTGGLVKPNNSDELPVNRTPLNQNEKLERIDSIRKAVKPAKEVDLQKLVKPIAIDTSLTPKSPISDENDETQDEILERLDSIPLKATPAKEVDLKKLVKPIIIDTSLAPKSPITDENDEIQNDKLEKIDSIPLKAKPAKEVDLKKLVKPIIIETSLTEPSLVTDDNDEIQKIEPRFNPKQTPISKEYKKDLIVLKKTATPSADNRPVRAPIEKLKSKISTGLPISKDKTDLSNRVPGPQLLAPVDEPITCKEAICKVVTEKSKEKPDEKINKYSCSYSITEQYAEVAISKEEPLELPTSIDQEELKITGSTEEGVEFALTCPISWEDEDSDSESEKEQPNLKLIITNKGPTTYTIEAKVTNLDTPEVIWEIQDQPKNSKITKDWEKTDKNPNSKDKGIKGMAADSEEDVTEAKDKPEGKPEDKKVLSPLKIIQPRVIGDYKVCATLKIKDKNSEPVCVVVDSIDKKKDENKLRYNPPTLQRPNQIPIRDTGSTSAFGIR